MTRPQLLTNGVSLCSPSGYLEEERVLKGSITKEQVEGSRDTGIPLHSHHKFPSAPGRVKGKGKGEANDTGGTEKPLKA